MAMGRRNQDSGNGEEKSKKISIQQLKEVKGMLSFIRPYRWHFIGGLILLFLGSVIFMAFPRLAGELVDVAAGKGKLGLSLNQIGLVLIVILVLQGIMSYLRVIWFAVVSEKGMADVRSSIYQKLIGLPVYFFEKNRVGDLTSRISEDVNRLSMVFSTTLAELIRQVLILITGVIFLLVTTPKLSLTMLGTFPVIVVGAMFFGRFVRNLSKSRQKSLANTNTVVEETLQNINTVKAFTNETFEYNRYKNEMGNVVKTSLLLAKYRAIFASFIIIILFGAIFFILWYGATMVQNNVMTTGQLVTFIAYTAIIGGSIGSLGNFYTEIVTALGGTERIREILNEPVEVNAPLTVVRPKVTGHIRFDDVYFEYPSRPEMAVLKGINMDIMPGQKIALVGQSGSGKSTIASLLMRLYPWQKGSITLDGQSINDMDLSSYRSVYALVPQEVLLFGGSIRENILYGRPQASEEELMNAARTSNSLEFIQSFPQGFETIVGERGIKLSGGQRQRIAIARAVLRNPDILILDEATSSLDAESEKVVQEALERLLEGRTAIIIAHRLATIRNVDCIYVLEDGKVIEKGTHDELILKDDGVYGALARLQFDI
ncbi:MAG: ATP-binding cassette domain-containing protein [Saprospiraceae bacterium]|uniref:ATP-binding cassette domain-containing protein n=1 Tax=Candidatus Opimibacter skivensis TaxID=2982028 RepID=A0A9D7XPA0_9BACT|nr:ATP-binding cassette domain-containing protein [Candidatus Opimibacter skivensis]